MTKWAISLVILALAAVAQGQTQVYDVTGGSGTVTTPARLYFYSQLSADELFLEMGVGTSCGGQTLPPLGFILLHGPEFGVNGVCAPVTSNPVGSCGQVAATFQGTDGNGQAFTGSVSFVTTCKTVRSRYTRTVYTVEPDSGQLTINY